MTIKGIRKVRVPGVHPLRRLVEAGDYKEFFKRITIKDAPAGYEIVGNPHWNEQWACIVIEIAHESFDTLPEDVIMFHAYVLTAQERNTETRRVKRVLISSSRILRLFTDIEPEHGIQFFNVIKLKGVPEDYTIVGQPYYEPPWDCIAFIIEHETFPEVPIGNPIPLYEEKVEFLYKCSPNTIKIKETDTDFPL